MTMAWDDEPPTDRKNLLHHALVGLNGLTRVPWPVLAAATLASASTAGWAWQAIARVPLFSVVAGGMDLFALLVDWIGLAALPRRGISFGPVEPSLLGLIGFRSFLSLLPLAGVAVGLPAEGCIALLAFLHAATSATIVYATRVEPFRLGVTYVTLHTSKLAPGKRVRLVQVSDLHVERVTRRERELIERVAALDADYVLLTGDYLNFSYVGELRAIADARQVLGGLRAREGMYAVRGTHQVDPSALLPVLFAGLPIHWLRNEHLTVGQDGCRLTFAGVSCTRQREMDVRALERALAGAPGEPFTVLLYHTPDLVSEAASRGVDLYLAGHTHGGQIRLPLYGALMTATDAGKRYEMGRYDIRDLTLYVSRGVGMEGMAAPRARFLCPPEIVCIDLEGVAPKTPRYHDTCG
jgi:predicted MPP superfamily phosphohydrolase